MADPGSAALERIRLAVGRNVRFVFLYDRSDGDCCLDFWEPRFLFSVYTTEYPDLAADQPHGLDRWSFRKPLSQVSAYGSLSPQGKKVSRNFEAS